MKTLALLIFALSSSLLLGTTLYVDFLQTTNPANHMYPTITEAYNASANGDEIVINPGDYFESLTIAKSITIKGSTQNSAKIFTNNQIGITVSGTTVSIKNLYFKCQDSYGIKLLNNCVTPTIRNCIFESCTRGIEIYTNTTVDISNCIFRSCHSGVIVTGYTVYGKVSNCLFKGSTYSVNYDGGTNYLNIFNNVFINNTNGVASQATNYGTIGYNIFYSNTSADYSSSLNIGPGNLINIDPLLNNVTGIPHYNYFIASNSPCIDAGNPSPVYNDLDGTRNDIGIYGGPSPWGDGKPVVLDIQLNPNTVQQGGTFNIQSTGQTK